MLIPSGPYMCLPCDAAAPYITLLCYTVPSLIFDARAAIKTTAATKKTTYRFRNLKAVSAFDREHSRQTNTFPFEFDNDVDIDY